MGKHRTAWHTLAAAFINERKPSCIQFESEVPLSRAPQRADLVLTRKTSESGDDAQAFFGIWERMRSMALIEYKSRSRPARVGVWNQLFSYAHQCCLSRRSDLTLAQDLSLFLLVHDITPTLHIDAQWHGLTLDKHESIYVPVYGGLFPTWVVVLNGVAEEEDEPLIGELGTRKIAKEDTASQNWLANFTMNNENTVSNQEGFDELCERFMKTPTFQKMVRESDLVQARCDRERIEERANILLHLLRQRFGELPTTAVRQVRTASGDRLIRWSERVLNAATLSAVLADDA
ncbi:MAG: hypothetical protein AAFN74_10430 [Myxococcota bacterium]